MDFLSELWLFMRVRKKFWLMPIFFMLVTVGGLMVLLTKGSVKTKEWNLLKEEFDALVRNGFPLQGSPPVGLPGAAAPSPPLTRIDESGRRVDRPATRVTHAETTCGRYKAKAANMRASNCGVASCSRIWPITKQRSEDRVNDPRLPVRSGP